jgi:hypothetical protein
MMDVVAITMFSAIAGWWLGWLVTAVARARVRRGSDWRIADPARLVRPQADRGTRGLEWHEYVADPARFRALDEPGTF